MSPYDLYEQERTDPKVYRCPHCESWHLGRSGSWGTTFSPVQHEVFIPCETCNGTGTISALDWDEVD